MVNLSPKCVAWNLKNIGSLVRWVSRSSSPGGYLQLGRFTAAWNWVVEGGSWLGVGVDEEAIDDCSDYWNSGPWMFFFVYFFLFSYNVILPGYYPTLWTSQHVMLRSPCVRVRGTTCCLVSLHSSTTRHLAVGCKKQPAVSGAESQPKKTGLVMTTTVCELENGHRNSEFSHEQWWFSIVMWVYQRVKPLLHIDKYWILRRFASW